MKLKPTSNRLLVKVLPEEPVKEGEPTPIKGMAVLKAEVLKVGPKVTELDIDVETIVYFAPFGFDEVSVGDEKLMLIAEDLIIAYE